MSKILLDCDPGIDDALAILFALKADRVSLDSITTVAGNVSVSKTTENALKIVELAGKQVDVAQGMAKPLLRQLRKAENVHGDDGLGNTDLPPPRTRSKQTHAVDQIITKIMTSTEETTLVATGPLTNLAVAVTKEPRIKNRVKEVVIMGGAIRGPGNVTPAAEFNFYSDPEAAKIVLHSGLPIKLVSLDVTMTAVLNDKHLDDIESRGTPVAKFTVQAVKYYMRFTKKHETPEGCPLHDPTAMALAIDESLIKKTERIYVDVETCGETTLGRALGDVRNLPEDMKNEANLTNCVEIDSDMLVKKFIATMKSYQ